MKHLCSWKTGYKLWVNQTDYLEVTIDEETVKKKLLKLQEDKAQGPDNFHPAVLCNCADTLSKPLSTTGYSTSRCRKEYCQRTGNQKQCVQFLRRVTRVILATIAQSH